MQLRLLKEQAYIEGRWVSAQDDKTFPVYNPSTGVLIGQVPLMGAEETKAAIESAALSFPMWQAKTTKERGQILRKWYNLILEHIEDLATILTLEQGKPLSEARSEIMYGASFVEWFAEEAKRSYGDIIPSSIQDQNLLVIKQPIGVVAAITPWNFPSAMITRKCAPAIAAGCTVVLKPAEATPFSALALAELASQAGIPKGVLNVITGDPVQIGQEMTSNPTVRKLTFTGSTKTGKLLMSQCSSTVKKLSLELGGSAPFLVFSDCDLSAAVEGLIMAKFRNTGQACTCADRIFVEYPIYKEFLKLFTNATEKLKAGDGFTQGVQQGPLINQAALEKVERHVQDAIQKGAKVACGGKRHKLGGTFYEPTVLYDVQLSMEIMQEETFGPIAPILSFRSEEEAIQMANNTRYGLASYLYTRDIDRIWRVTKQLEFGMVSVNGGFFSNEMTPFGGVKESGIGREGSKYGLDEYLEMKYICQSPSSNLARA